MSKLSRTKGHSFEREISIALRLVWKDARRHLEYQDAEANGVDIANTGPYKFQCKRGRRHASFTAIKEIEADEVLGDIPVLVSKGDHDRILVALPFEAFLDLLKIKYGKT
jgi:hypothetical protein